MSKKILLQLRPKAKTISLSCAESCCYTLMRPDIVYTIINNLENSRIAYITMCAGGGAGGVGCISGIYFISGGGGGAGCTIQHKPVLIKPNQQLHIKLGRGGVASKNRNGEKSYLRLVELDRIVYELSLDGGKNGHPLLCELEKDKQFTIESTTGGLGGQSKLKECLSGCDGKKGLIGIPSQMVSLGGSGGCNVLELGGDGGANVVCEGGYGGNNSNIDIIGGNGMYGSGGGGSCPLSNHQIPQLSGNGGDGFATVQICCEII